MSFSTRRRRSPQALRPQSAPPRSSFTQRVSHGDTEVLRGLAARGGGQDDCACRAFRGANHCIQPAYTSGRSGVRRGAARWWISALVAGGFRGAIFYRLAGCALLTKPSARTSFSAAMSCRGHGARRESAHVSESVEKLPSVRSTRQPMRFGPLRRAASTGCHRPCQCATPQCCCWMSHPASIPPQACRNGQALDEPGGKHDSGDRARLSTGAARIRSS